MAVTTIALPGRTDRRVQYKERTVEGIISFDQDNAYPQRILYTLAASGTGTSCVDLARDFYYGLGFEDENFGKAIVNRYGLTGNELLHKIAGDVSKLDTAYIAVVYNGLLKAVEYLFVPSEFVRYCIPGDDGVVRKFAIYDDWNCKKKKSVQTKKIQYIDVFSTDPNVMVQQITNAKGLENWNGQLFAITKAMMPEYSTAPCDPVIRDVETDGLVQVFKNRAVTKGFMPNGIFSHPGRFETKEKRQAFIDSLMDFQGAENSNSLILCEYDTPELKPEFTPMVFPRMDQVFERTEVSVKENIREKFKAPPILLSSQRNATTINFGENKELESAAIYFDKVTAPVRLFISSSLQKLFVAPSEVQAPTTFKITSIGDDLNKSGSYIFKSLGKEATDGIKEILKSSTPREYKINQIFELYGVDRDRISSMIPPDVAPTNTPV